MNFADYTNHAALGRRRTEALLALARKQAAELPDGDLPTLEGLFDDWKAGVSYAAGDIARHGGRLYRCLQAHTAQADWTPDAAVSLFAGVRLPGDAPLSWVPGELVEAGDIRLHDGNEYRCLQAHTTLEGWTPPATPSLWERLGN